jgi:hypothetical protein
MVRAHELCDGLRLIDLGLLRLLLLLSSGGRLHHLLQQRHWRRRRTIGSVACVQEAATASQPQSMVQFGHGGRMMQTNRN